MMVNRIHHVIVGLSGDWATVKDAEPIGCAIGPVAKVYRILSDCSTECQGMIVYITSVFVQALRRQGRSVKRRNQEAVSSCSCCVHRPSTKGVSSNI